MTELSWRRLVAWSVAGTLVAVLWVLLDLFTFNPQLGTLVDTSPADRSAATLRAELGDDAVIAGGKHDGAYYYVIARDPFDLDAASEQLDGPQYRLQRIGFPMVAWVLHPIGGGPGLMWAMFAVGVISLVGGGVALGALSQTLRGPPWLAVLFPLMLGSWISLRITVADPMGLALAIAAIVLLWRNRLLPALLVGVAAVLTREASLLLFIGVVLSMRTKRSLLLVAVPGAVGALWFLVLRVSVPRGDPVPAFALPFASFPRAWDFWSQLFEPRGITALVAALLVAAIAFKKSGLSHPLAWVVLLQVLFLLVLTPSVLVPERSITRQVMAMTVLAAVMWATPKARAALDAATDAPARHADADGHAGVT